MAENQVAKDVFISYKSEDVALAKALSHYLVSKGLSVFVSSQTLPQLGSSDYRKAIDSALDECRHMIVVGSKVDYLSSLWLEAEWGFFISEKRAGRKKGNILTVVTDDIEIKNLPASLRYYEVIFFEEENFERIAAYVGKDYQDRVYKPKRQAILKSKWLLPGISLLVLTGLLWYYINEKNKPFDATVFVRPDAALNLHPDYPVFEGGELSLYIGSKEDKKSVLPNQSITFQQIPISFAGKRIGAKLNAQNWKLLTDTVLLNTNAIYISIVPDGSLASVYGNIKDGKGNPVEGCSIAIDGDTIIHSNAAGLFKVNLPYYMQKNQYILSITRRDFYSQKIDYFSASGSVDIVLKH
ncbi:toll/interleukin-1 receptor domain-containing protein [Segetibacter sp.]|jgi:hypothetical protein|uniref:toll/interleukin-1 receptor domain-containing protein n=1 Tax=Segetibacter sp. TaxID=2231182 RepID=UPI00261B64BE|nr:toll/interleukin-1 receptor domain-containing protein [Segetibacter sp.]MCW3081055.1 hypothetical protein [Segetibacter sp.]